MTEVERMLHLPVRLNYPLPGMLRDVLRRTFDVAKIEPDVDGMVRAVSWGLRTWSEETRGIGMHKEQVLPAFVRMLAIAVPDLFVVAHDRGGLEGYDLSEEERKVLEDSREVFNAKVEIAKAFHKAGRPFNFANVIKESPEFRRAAGVDMTVERRQLRH